ncbi:hypothetical protein EV121DRAFT_204389 [Schizophyllum commune]
MPAATEIPASPAAVCKKSSVGTAEPLSTKKALRPRRPKYHKVRTTAERSIMVLAKVLYKRLHPSHADLPFVPDERARLRHRFWYFGWPVSETFVNNIIDIYFPEFLDDDHPPSVRLARFLDIAEGVTKYSPFRLVLVEPDAYMPIEEYQSSSADTGETAVTFCMVVSDARKSLFVQRPTTQQMAKLIENNTTAVQGDSSVGTAEPQSPRKAPRPKYHKRLHPSHADIPFVPEERDRTPHRFWHFGWPVSDAFATNVLDTYIPGFLETDPPPSVKYARFMALAKLITKCDPDSIRIVLVEPDVYTPLAEYQSPFVEGEEKAVTFCMVVSDARKRLFTERPTEEQMAKLISFFGAEPRWKMDAREKSLWRRYGHGN